MPLPLGHTAVGWAVNETGQHINIGKGGQTNRSPLATFVFATVLANLPDLDVLFGLLFYGNGAAIHRGPTHSLLFALLAGWLASQAWRFWRKVPKIGFGLCFALIFSHVAADMLLTNTPVSLFWPIEIYFSPGHSGWGQVLHMVVFRSLQDVGIVLVCLVYVSALRVYRRGRHLFLPFAFARKRVK